MSLTAIGSMPVNGSSSSKNAGSVASALRDLDPDDVRRRRRLSARACSNARSPNSSSNGPSRARPVRRARRRAAPRSNGCCRRPRACGRSNSLARDRPRPAARAPVHRRVGRGPARHRGRSSDDRAAVRFDLPGRPPCRTMVVLPAPRWGRAGRPTSPVPTSVAHAVDDGSARRSV